MSIFVIKQHGMPKDTQVDDTQATKVTLPAAEQAEAVVDASAEGAALAAQGASAEDKPEAMVRINGPVGRIYTDALNKLLATESYMMTLAPDAEELPDVLSDAPNGSPSRTIELFAAQADQIEYSDVVKLMNEATLHQSRDYVIAAESAGQVTMKMAMLENLSHLPNVKLCYSRARALDIVKDLLT